MSHIDEPNTAVQTNAEGADSIETSPVSESKPLGAIVEVSGEVMPDQANESTETPVTQESAKPTRAERRLKQILNKYGEVEGEEPSAPLNNQQFNANPLPTPPWYQPTVQPGQELTQEQYQQHVTRSASEIAKLEVEKARQEWQAQRQQDINVDRFNREVEKVYTDYPELAENEDLDDKVTRLYKKASGGKPDASLLREIVSTAMELSQHARVEGQTTVTNQLVKQASEAAIAPTSSRSNDVTEESLLKMSPEQRVKYLETKLSIAS